MGYYTNFTKLKASKKFGDESVDSLRFWDEVDSASVLSKVFNSVEDFDDMFDGEIKWYDHEEDLKKISKFAPDVMFSIGGEGEENTDVWKMYVMNGVAVKVQPELVWPDEMTIEDFASDQNNKRGRGIKC